MLRVLDCRTCFDLPKFTTASKKGLKITTRTASNSAAKPQTVILGGPTAVGKSKLALLLEKSHNGVLVNADATKLYKGLICGANKSAIGTTRVRLWDLIDATSPNAEFSAGQYHDVAKKELQSIIHNEAKLPIVVGGSGLYLRWLLRGKQAGPARDREANIKILTELETQPWEAVIQRVAAFDPIYAGKILENDYRRAARAIELNERTGATLGTLVRQRTDSIYNTVLESNEMDSSAQNIPLQSHTLQNESPPWQKDVDFRPFLLTLNRKDLYDQICTRCEKMILDGLFLEVWNLMKQGLTPNSTPGKAIGYRQTMDFLNAQSFTEESLLSFLSDFQSKTRQLAHRQISWFRKEYDFYPLDVSNPEKAHEIVSNLLILPQNDWIEAVKLSRASYDSVENGHESVIKEHAELRIYKAPTGQFFLPKVNKKQRTHQYHEDAISRKAVVANQLRILDNIHFDMIRSGFVPSPIVNQIEQ